MSHSAPMPKDQAYLPDPSHWPIVGSVALTCIVVGLIQYLHQGAIGPWLGALGACILITMLVGWFGQVIRENQGGLYQNALVDRAFRMGMAWFIFSEVMFFCAFFGALFYTRVFTLPMYAGDLFSPMTHLMQWSGFELQWPLMHTPDPSKFLGPQSVMDTWGIPAANTLILLTSGVTITIAHVALLNQQRLRAIGSQLATILLGLLFLVMQAYEYGEAYMDKGLKLSSGIYGSTFFMLTGFHGLHVTLGTIMLIVILARLIRGHFTPKHHFAFEAVAWYWHFVDIVWLGLFIFVYWI